MASANVVVPPRITHPSAHIYNTHISAGVAKGSKRTQVKAENMAVKSSCNNHPTTTISMERISTDVCNTVAIAVYNVFAPNHPPVTRRR